LDKKVTFDRLTPEAQQIFREKKLRFGYYCELSYEQECDVFRRVQLGMPLQGAGKFHPLLSVDATERFIDYLLFLDGIQKR